MDYKEIFNLNSGYSFGSGTLALIILLAVWELVWKGLALWKAAQSRQTSWFVAILLLNTIGILPILYLYVFSPKQNQP